MLAVVDALEVSVTPGEPGPVVTLSGEADVTSAGRLSEFLAAQMPAGARDLVVDVSGLSFADSASVRVLVLTGKALRKRGGRLVLLRPQPPVARVLELTGADELLAVRGSTMEEAGLRPESPDPEG
jgi:anti-sigma B factor antagonist